MNSKSSAFRTILIVVIFIALEAISLLLITKNSVVQRYKIMELIRSSQAFFWNNGEDTKAYFHLKQSNEDLALENEQLKNSLEEIKFVRHYAIEDMDSSLFDFTHTHILAKVIRNSTNKPHNSIIINKGRNHGIEEEMGVVTANGIIGYVHSVGNNFARITSFLDINHSIGAMIKSNKTFGPLKWEGLRIDQAILKEIPIHTTLSKGDTIVTSGYSVTYPANIPLGVIDSYEIIDGVNYNVTVNLFENYSSLEYVYVVRNPQKEELLNLINEEDKQ